MLESKKRQINPLLQNRGKKEFYLPYCLPLTDYLSHPYVEVPNVLDLKQQSQRVERNVN
jgi:hypothetical protein